MPVARSKKGYNRDTEPRGFTWGSAGAHLGLTCGSPVAQLGLIWGRSRDSSKSASSPSCQPPARCPGRARGAGEHRRGGGGGVIVQYNN
ncbi:unnamed protein product [Lampetra fluviatilis]